MASNLIPLFTIKSATPATSAKVGILRPIPWTEREKLEVREHDHWALGLGLLTGNHNGRIGRAATSSSINGAARGLRNRGVDAAAKTLV